MAVTKLLRLKQAKQGNPSSHLKNNIKYICNPEKTQGMTNIGGNAGCTPEEIYNAMLDNKAFFGKRDKTQGFHYIVSFPPDANVTTEMLHVIAREFCEELLGERYLYVYAIHDDKAHLHFHVTFDSVSREDGKKFHSPKGDWEARIQPITDRICQKYDLPKLTYEDERVGVPYIDWLRNKQAEETNGQTDGSGKRSFSVTWYDLVRDDIDDTIRIARDYPDFLRLLREQHYVVRDGKYLSLKPYGRNKAIRSRSLGAGYGKAEIEKRIALERQSEDFAQNYKHYGDARKMRELIRIKRERYPGWKMGSLQKLFYLRWQNTCMIRRPGYKSAWKYKKDVIELQKLSDQLTYLFDHDIGTLDDFNKHAEQIRADSESARLQQATARSRLYNPEVCKLVLRYSKLKKQEQGGSDYALKMQELKEKIELIMPLADAITMREERQQEYDCCRQTARNLRAENRMVNAISEQVKELQLRGGTNELQGILRDSKGQSPERTADRTEGRLL